MLEWEDTFPWQGHLTNLSLAQGGYSQEEAEEIVAFAERTLGFEVIPLVQTFGHVEYVLKMEQFKHLRELEGDPQSFCPSKSGTLVLVQQMIDQVGRAKSKQINKLDNKKVIFNKKKEKLINFSVLFYL